MRWTRVVKRARSSSRHAVAIIPSYQSIAGPRLAKLADGVRVVCEYREKHWDRVCGGSSRYLRAKRRNGRGVYQPSVPDNLA